MATKSLQLRARGGRRLRALPAPPRSERLAQWDDSPATTDLALPSGKRLLARRPDLAAMASRGLIPPAIVAGVERLALHPSGGAIEAVIAGDARLAPGERLTLLGDFWALVDTVCVAAAVDPPVSYDGRPGTLAVSRIGLDDRLFIWRWGSAQLRAPIALAGAVLRSETKR